MPKSISVQFEDGTSHTNDNVPDDVTQEQIDARAKMDYPDRTVAEVAEGAHPEAPAVAPPEKEQDLATQALGYGKAALDTAIEHPAVPAAAVGLYKANKVANTWMASKNAEIEAAKYIAAKRAAAQAGHQEVQMAKLAAKGATPVQPQIPGANGAPMEAPTRAMAPAVPQAPVNPPAGGPAAQQGANFIENITKRFAPVAERVAPALQTAGRVLAPVARVAGSAPVQGALLAMHTTGLNTNEDQELARRRAEGEAYARKMGWIK